MLSRRSLQCLGFMARQGRCTFPLNLNRRWSARPIRQQRLATISVALFHLCDGIEAGLGAIFILDIRRNFPLMIPKKSQNGHNGSVTLAEWNRRAVVLFPVFDMQCDNAGMMLADKGDRIAVGGCEMANIQIDGKIL